MEERHVQAFEVIVQHEFNRPDNRRLRVASPAVGMQSKNGVVLPLRAHRVGPLRSPCFTCRAVKRRPLSLLNESLVMKLKTFVCVTFAS